MFLVLIMTKRLKSIYTEQRFRDRSKLEHTLLRTDDIDRLTVTLSSSLSSFPLANTRVSRHLNTDVFSTLKCRVLFLLVMHSRTPSEKNYFFLRAIAVISIVNHICLLHHLNELSSIFTHASYCILDTLAEPCFLHVPSLSAVAIFVDFLQSV